MKKRLVLILIFMLALVLVGCGEKPSGNGGGTPGGDTPGGDTPGGDTPVTGFSWEGKEVEKIVLLRDKLQAEYDFDEFDLSMLFVEVTFADGTKHEFSCDDEHFDLSKPITTTGKPRLTIICTDDEGNEVETANFTISIVSYTTQDERALDAAANVIMVKRNGEKVDFIIAKTSGIASGQLQYTFDTTKLTLGEVTKGTTVGYVNASVSDGKISIGFANDANLEAGTVICSIAYTGDYRNSSIAINEEFANGLWTLVENTPTSMNDISYHTSRK